MNSEPEPIGIMAALLRIEQKYGLPQRPAKLILPENLPMPCDKKESSDVQLSSLECHGQPFTPEEFRDRIKQQLFGGESYGG